MKDSNLYLLHFPKINALKIGKANTIQNRVDVLTRYWGEVDYAESYYLEAKEQDVFKLERALHFFLAHYKLDFEYGEGKEEMFKVEALEHVQKHINVYIESSGNNLVLKKGLTPKPFKTVLEKQSKEPSFTSFIKRDKAALLDLSENHQKILKIHKLAHFFLKHHKRIKYQYSYQNGDFKIAFIEEEGAVKNIDLRKLRELFDYNHTLFKSFEYISYMVNYTSVIGTHKVAAFYLDLSGTETREKTNMHYHINGLLCTVSKLPQRSALLETDILTEGLFQINYSNGPWPYCESL